jgi:hypothetical protein
MKVRAAGDREGGERAKKIVRRDQPFADATAARLAGRFVDRYAFSKIEILVQDN